MAFSSLTLRDAQEIIEGSRLPGRDDLERVRAIADFLRASGDGEPPPPMSADLVRQIDLGTPPAN